MKNTLKILACLFGSMSILASAEAQATIYKCISVKDGVYYNDKPCPGSNIESKIKAIKVPAGGNIASATLAEDSLGSSTKSVVVETKTISSQSNDSENSNADSAVSSLNSRVRTDFH